MDGSKRCDNGRMQASVMVAGKSNVCGVIEARKCNESQELESACAKLSYHHYNDRAPLDYQVPEHSLTAAVQNLRSHLRNGKEPIPADNDAGSFGQWTR